MITFGISLVNVKDAKGLNPRCWFTHGVLHMLCRTSLEAFVSPRPNRNCKIRVKSRNEGGKNKLITNFIPFVFLITQ